MGEDIVCDAYLEVYDDGSCLAQLLDLLGCYAQGASEAEALAVLSARIPAYYTWLSRHDEYTPQVHGPFQVTVAERVRVSATEPDGHGRFFTPDAEPIRTEDLDWALALLDWAYEDLCRDVEAAMRAGGAVAEQAQAIVRDAAAHQLWLLLRLGADAATHRIDTPHAGALDQLRQVRRASVARLLATTEHERAQVLDGVGERWSLRKIVRRSVLCVRMYDDALLARAVGR